jgi:hypothetical protein
MTVFSRPQHGLIGERERMGRKRLRQRCEARVRDLDIPVPFDAAELCRRLACGSGRAIRLVPLDLPPDGPCGVWVSTAATEYIVYERRTSPLHQEHIILHEVGHLLCRHEATPLVGDSAARLLFPHLDPGIVRRVLGRTHYTAVEEQEAELIASMILERTHRQPPEPSWSVAPETAGIVSRIEHSLRSPSPGHA